MTTRIAVDCTSPPTTLSAQCPLRVSTKCALKIIWEAHSVPYMPVILLRISYTSHQSAHLPPCSEGLSCMVRKNPRRSNATLLLAISPQNALALPESAGFILQELITTSKISKKMKRGGKKKMILDTT